MLQSKYIFSENTSLMWPQSQVWPQLASNEKQTKKIIPGDILADFKNMC